MGAHETIQCSHKPQAGRFYPWQTTCLDAGKQQTLQSHGQRKETWYMTVLSEFLLFSNELVVQAIIKNTTTFYTKPCAYTYALCIYLRTHTHTAPGLPASTKPAPPTSQGSSINLHTLVYLPGEVKRTTCQTFHDGVFSPFTKGYKTHLKISVSRVSYKTATTTDRPSPTHHPSLVTAGGTNKEVNFHSRHFQIWKCYINGLLQAMEVRREGAEPTEQTFLCLSSQFLDLSTTFQRDRVCLLVVFPCIPSPS